MPKTGPGQHRHIDSRGKWTSDKDLPHTHDFTETPHPADGLTDAEIVKLRFLIGSSGQGGGGTTPEEPNPPPPPPPPDVTAPVISNVVLGPPTTTTCPISCQTDESATVVAEYGTTQAYGSQQALTSGTSHTGTLSGLTPGATYQVRLKATDASGNIRLDQNRVFTAQSVTPPPPPPVGGLPPIRTYASLPINSDPRPAYLGSIIDSTFGTEIFCVSNLNGMRNSYPTHQPWNADGSRAYLAYPSSGNEIIDGVTYAGVRPGPEGFGYGFWDPDDPDLMYGNTLSAVRTWRPSTNTYATVGSIPGMAMLDRGKGEGTYSIDKKRIAYIFRTTGGQNGVLVWDLDVGAEISRRYFTLEPNNCGISRKGDFVVVVHHPSSGLGTMLYRATDMEPRYQLAPGTPHRDVALDENGNDVLVYVNNAGTGAECIRMLDQTTKPAPIFVIDGVAGSGHISGTCHELPGYALISVNLLYPGAKGNDQIFLVKLDGSRVVRPWCFAHTAQPSGSYNYDYSTHAAASPDGTKAMWGGRWNNAGDNLSYVVQMP